MLIMTNRGLKKVVLADKKYVSNLVMKNKLESLGFSKFISKHNGKEAMEYLRQLKDDILKKVFQMNTV